ncbi:MAG: tetratricopeptide repeat protein [Candidatus Cyclobacteriaceae bacterium M2_1C_046]
MVVLLLIYSLNFNFTPEGQPIISPAEYTLKADSCVKAFNYSCGIKYYKKSIELLDSSSNRKLLARTNLHLADLYYQIGDFKNSHVYYSNAKKISEELELKEVKAKSLQGLAHIYWRSGDNIQSIENIIESVKLFKAIHDTSSYIAASNIMAGIYVSNGELDEAEEIYNKMLQIAINASDSVRIANNYEYKGIIYFFRGDYKKAIDFYQNSLKINTKIGEELQAGINYGNIGEAFSKLKNYEQALNNYDKAVEIQRKYNFTSGLIFIYYSKGEALTALGKLEPALDFYKESILLMESSGELREKHHVYKLIADNYFKQKKFKDAYAYHQLYTSEKDSLFNIDKAAQLEEIKSKYEFDKKVQENDFLSMQNALKAQELESKQATIQRQYLFAILLLLFLCISIYLSIRLYRIKNNLSIANKSKERLFSFIAHDLKGPVGNIKSLADLLNSTYKQENITGEKAELLDYISESATKVSTLLNNLLAWAVSQQDGFRFNSQKVNLLELVNQNISLFSFQIENKQLNVQNEVPADLFAYADEDALLTIIRNILSNAIKFTKENGNIQISASESDSDVILVIKDDGLGMTKKKVKDLMTSNNFISTQGTANEKGSGLGFSLIKEFIKAQKGKLLIESDPQQGTKVEVSLPSL